jgi:hypothetical protein
MRLEKDLPPGKPWWFISGGASCIWRRRVYPQGLFASGVDNLRNFGGEIIRDLHHEPSLRKNTVERLLRGAIHADGGPLVHNSSEEAERSVDSTCG